MLVDIYFDTVCPWSFIGRHRLGRAVALWRGPAIRFRWRPFLLNAHIPHGGFERPFFGRRRGVAEGRSRRLHNLAIEEAARAEGLTLALDRITRLPNTIDSHRLIRLAARSGRADAMADRLFGAYFQDGLDIGDTATLCHLAAEIGLSSAQARAYLESDADLEEVEADNFAAHRLGVNGIPCYLVDRRFAIAGAQEPEVFLRLFDLAASTALVGAG